MAGLFHSVFLTSIWASLLIAVILLLNRAFKKQLPVSWHYYIWVLVMARLLFPVFITLPVENPVRTTKAVIGITEPAPVAQNHQNTAINTPLAIPAPKEDVAAGEPRQDKANANVMEISQGTPAMVNSETVYFIWLLGVFILLAYKLINYFIYNNRLMKTNMPSTQQAIDILRGEIKQFHISPGVQLYINPTAPSPFAMGIKNPVIILPHKDYTNLQLSYILRHEIVHIKRKDILLKWLFELAKAVHWFNPFVYLAAKAANFYCEVSCDKVVMESSKLAERKDYSMTILEMISHTISPKTSLCVPLGNTKKDLKKRIDYVLNRNKYQKSLPCVLISTILLLTLAACSGVQYKELQPVEQAVIGPGLHKLNKMVPTAQTITNVVIAGLDDTRADVLMLGSFNTETNIVHVVSIPRDTYLNPTDATVAKLNEKGVALPNHLRFSELTAYADGHGEMDILKHEVSHFLNVPVDYYIKLDMAGFQNIVDAVNGVEMTVPEGGLYYVDNAQNLEISLEGGTQLLDGDAALKFVRFRASYEKGDLDRIHVQQQFISQLYNKMLASSLLEKITTAYTLLDQNTQTDITLNSLMPYVKYIPNLNGDCLEFTVLPVETKIIHGRHYLDLNRAKFNQTLLSSLSSPKFE